MLLCYGSILLRYKTTSQAFITCSRKGDWRHSRQADKNGLVQVREGVVTLTLYDSHPDMQAMFYNVAMHWIV